MRMKSAGVSSAQGGAAASGGGGGGGQSFGDWYNQYAAQQRMAEEGEDVESGLLGNVHSFFHSHGLGAQHDTVSGFASRFMTSIRGDQETGQGGLINNTKQSIDSTLTYTSRLRSFLLLLFLGLFFYLLAFFVGLPVILFRPAKFALCATMGSLLTMSSFGALVGPQAHIQSLFKWERLPFSCMYVGSLFLTLYASLVARSYILVCVSMCVQIGALAWYLVAFLPGGPGGLRTVGGWVCGGVGRCGQAFMWLVG